MRCEASAHEAPNILMGMGPVRLKWRTFISLMVRLPDAFLFIPSSLSIGRRALN